MDHTSQSAHAQLTYENTGEPHPYHIVDPSIWPLLSSFAGGLFAVGMILLMHDVRWNDLPLGYITLGAGLLSILICMFFWWKDVIYEAIIEKAHTDIAKIGMRYGMALFIASEVMFFVAFFWAFFDVSLFAGQENMPLRLEYTSGQWPPPQYEVFQPFDLPFLMTMLLLLSGCSVTWAHHAVVEGNRESMIQALFWSVVIGFVFLGFQVYEYGHAKYGFTEGAYPSTFFMATGFHGFHVFVGTIFLAVCYFRAKRGAFTPDDHFGFEAAAWYWHFVDVVWLFLFMAIYVWGNAIGVAPPAG